MPKKLSFKTKPTFTYTQPTSFPNKASFPNKPTFTQPVVTHDDESELSITSPATTNDPFPQKTFTHDSIILPESYDPESAKAAAANSFATPYGVS